MGTKKSNLVVLAILLAALTICVLAGCKKKVKSVEVEFPEMFTEEQQIQLTTFESEQDQPDQLFNYSLSENNDEEFDEEPDEDEEEPSDDSGDSNDEGFDDEEEYPDEDSNDYYEDDPNDYPDEEPNDSEF